VYLPRPIETEDGDETGKTRQIAVFPSVFPLLTLFLFPRIAEELTPLNLAQQKATNTLSGPLLVLAGAGTGKTRVVTVRIANLIKSGIEPDRILAVTFTNKAAGEMQERIGKLPGIRLQKTKKPFIGTFHALCVRILRRHIAHLGYPERFIIVDRGEQESIARRALREIRAPEASITPAQAVSQISHWKSRSLRPHEAASQVENDRQDLAAIVWPRYQQYLRSQGAVDFDDLLLLVEELFGSLPDVRHMEASLFDHILIDEYQDTNSTQYRIIRHLAEKHRNLCVVGDDDQSIYGFRGAEVRHILNFRKDWPEAKVVNLEENYRSTGPIIELANRLISFNLDRHDKKLRSGRPQGLKPEILQFPSETKEAQEVVARIRGRLGQPGAQPSDFAILFRTKEQPRLFEEALRKAKLPYVLIGGQSFYDRKEVKDLLAWLRLLHNPKDELSLRRIVNVPPRGLGHKVLEQILQHATQTGHEPGELVLNPSLRPSISTAANAGLDEIRKVLSIPDDRSLTQRVRELIDQSRYRSEIDRAYDDPEERESRWNSVEQVVNAVSQYERESANPSMGDFIDLVTLDDRQLADDKEKQLERNAIAMMTLHSAKGLEFQDVFMVGMEENILPHHRSAESDLAVDEERRLCYVGVTRARERLTLTMALSRMKWGKPRPTLPSRFLYEMTGQADHPKYLACLEGDSD
jgi:DNA helicase II / ATP-dependent DNA helicase PcrA